MYSRRYTKSKIPRPKNYHGGRSTAQSTYAAPPTAVAKRNSAPNINSSECKIIANHNATVMSGLEALWRQRIMCDVEIVIGSHAIHAHAVILASCSDYCHDLIASYTNPNSLAPLELRLEHLEFEAVQNLIDSMYSGKITLKDENIYGTLEAASFLKYFAIETCCSTYLTNRLTTDNCLRMIAMGASFNLQNLTDSALKMAAENFTELTQGFDFQQMEVRHLCSLISRDDIKAENELEIFKRTLTWINVDRTDRIRFSSDVLQRIRLPLLKPKDIVDHVETVHYLMEIPICQELVKESLHYHCLPARQSILQTTRTIPRTSNTLDTILAMGGAPRLKSDPVGSNLYYLVAVLGGFVYVAGGEACNDQRSPLNSALRYDPRSDNWLNIADMKNSRESFNMVVLNGMIYAVGGRLDGTRSLSEVERYNPAIDEWESVASLSSPRRSIALAAHNGRLYAIGGSGDRRISNKVERYNPLTDHWELRKPLAVPRFFALLAAVKNNIFLMGGATLGEKPGDIKCVAAVECYTPLSDTWCTVTPMIDPRAEAGCAVLGNKVYVVGGYSWDKSVRLSSVEEYDVETDTWKNSGNIAAPYTGVGCCAVTLYDVTEENKNNKVEHSLRISGDK